MPALRSSLRACTCLSFLLAAALLPGESARAETIETQAKQAIIIDSRTGAVLLEKNADELMTPSSMSKLMTVYMVFSRLKDGSLRLSDSLPVSETAWRKHFKSGGSLMFLPVNSSAKVEELLRGVIIQSGNDACSVLAEGLAGSEEAFAEEETRMGRKIGLTSSTFRNASGLPDPAHKMTARDLATLANRIISDFPEYYPIFSERSYVFNKIKQDNRNPLLYQNIPGADGLKTGHTEEAGFGLTGSAMRDGRRIILVINGLAKMSDRAEESKRLIEWAFREFDDVTLFRSGEKVADAEVWQGVAASVPLVTDKGLEVTLPRSARSSMTVTAHYNSPLPAPLRKGDQVGDVTVSVPGQKSYSLPLVAGADVERLGFFGRIGNSLHRLLMGPKG